MELIHPSMIQGFISVSFLHLDLVAVAVSVAAIATLGFVVFFSDQKSATNRAFLWFALATIAYGTANYFSYQTTTPDITLWLLRITLFTAVWHAFSFFSLFRVFPKSHVELPWWYLYLLTPTVMLTSLLTLSPLVFTKISSVAVATGQVANPERGPGIAVFGIVAVLLVAGGLAELFVKAVWGTDLEKKQARVVMVGAVSTFALILTFNFLLPVVFNVLDYIPLAPLFFLPFIIFTAHAIQKYRLLNIKIIATEIFTFALAIVSLIEIIFAKDFYVLLLRVGIFALVLGFGILLIRSVIKEVKQRELLRTLSANLQSANVRLVELDRLKSQFLSFASHQIKSPLTSIKWQSQLISDGSLGVVPKEVTDTAHGIEEAADRLVTLVNEFLNLRKIEEGKMDYQMERMDVSELVARVVHDLGPLANHKGLKLSLTDTASHRLAMLDTQKFTQIIQNIIDNAIKYTETGSVAVSVINDPADTITINVTDTGHGLDADLIPHLFEEYKRDTQGTAKKIEGTGLGLYIAKQIIDAHKGTITVTSPGRGKGSTFSIRIPVAA